MRRSFKDHIRACCKLHNYNYVETEENGRWVLRVDRYIKIFNSINEKNLYVLLDNVKDIRCTVTASEWGLMAAILHELMEEHLHQNQKQN